MSNISCNESYNELFLDLLKSKKIQKKRFNSEESYQIGYELANNLNKIYQGKIDFGYKKENFINLVENLRNQCNDVPFIEGINKQLEKCYLKSDNSKFVLSILTGKNGYKFFYIIKNYISKENLAIVIWEAPYLNIINILKELSMFKYLNPNQDKMEYLSSMNSLYELFIENGCSNNDERVFSWALDIYSNLNKLGINLIDLKLIVKQSLSRPNIPEKYIFRRLKYLSKLGDLKNKYFEIIRTISNFTWKIFEVLTKYYYDKNKSETKNFIRTYNILNLFINSDYQNRIGFVRKYYSSSHFNFLKKSILDGVQDLRFVSINEDSIPNLKNIFEIFLQDMDLNTKLRFIQGLNFYCCHQLDFNKPKIVFEGKLPLLLKNLYQQFSDLRFESNPSIMSIVRPTFKNIHKEYIRMNLLGTYMKIFLKKKYNNKLKMIKQKNNDLIQELLTFNSNTKIPVLSLGCKYHQIRNSSYLNLSLDNPKCSFLKLIDIIPEEYKKNIQTKMLSNIKPFKLNKLIKAYFIEERQTYLVYDINMPNLTYLERMEYLRKINPLTKYYTIPILTSDKQINDFKEEQLNIINQLSRTWYPLPIFFKN